MESVDQSITRVGHKLFDNNFFVVRMLVQLLLLCGYLVLLSGATFAPLGLQQVSWLDEACRILLGLTTGTPKSSS